MTEIFSIFSSKHSVMIETYIVEQENIAKTLPSIVICPGGGYVDLSSKEGKPVVVYLNTLGYNVFVFSYSVKNNILNRDYRWPEPLLDLGTAMLYIKSYVADWNVDKNNIYLCGFSAGGHLVAMYATCWKKSYRAIF